MAGKLIGNSVLEQAHRAIEKAREFANTVQPSNDGRCPWCNSVDHWAGHVELCSSASSRAITAVINDA